MPVLETTKLYTNRMQNVLTVLQARSYFSRTRGLRFVGLPLNPCTDSDHDACYGTSSHQTEYAL